MDFFECSGKIKDKIGKSDKNSLFNKALALIFAFIL